MPRNYVRVKTNVLPTDEALKNAIIAVHSKELSIRHAAENLNLSKSTVGFYCKRHTLQSIISATKPTIKIKHNPQIFPKTQEEEIVQYLQSCCLLNHGLTPHETRKLAHQYAEANNVKTPASWITHQEASRDWFTAFLKRNPVLSIRKPEATSQARAAGFNKVVVNEFYDNLGGVYQQKKYPHATYGIVMKRTYLL
jgi:helix-turn-helix, Psq domain